MGFVLNFNTFVRENTELRVSKEAIEKIQKHFEEEVKWCIKESEHCALENKRKTITESDVVFKETPMAIDDSEDDDDDDSDDEEDED